MIGPLVIIFTVLGVARAAFCDADYVASECPGYCTDTLVGKCCSRVGETAKMMTVPSGSHAMAIVNRVDQSRPPAYPPGFLPLPPNENE